MTGCIAVFAPLVSLDVLGVPLTPSEIGGPDGAVLGLTVYHPPAWFGFEIDAAIVPWPVCAAMTKP